ncbi:MAG: hypothetical protein LBR80_16725 [Deltaproteobacteria bacterium]|nr:hypothetical protein [Deltaproteobacteria bacterium]
MHCYFLFFARSVETSVNAAVNISLKLHFEAGWDRGLPTRFVRPAEAPLEPPEAQSDVGDTPRVSVAKKGEWN